MMTNPDAKNRARVLVLCRASKQACLESQSRAYSRDLLLPSMTLRVRNTATVVMLAGAAVLLPTVCSAADFKSPHEEALHLLCLNRHGESLYVDTARVKPDGSVVAFHVRFRDLAYMGWIKRQDAPHADDWFGDLSAGLYKAFRMEPGPEQTALMKSPGNDWARMMFRFGEGKIVVQQLNQSDPATFVGACQTNPSPPDI